MGLSTPSRPCGKFVIVHLSSYTSSIIFPLQGEKDELETDGQARRVPAVVTMAAFHKVSVCACMCVCLMGCKSHVVNYPYLGVNVCVFRLSGGVHSQERDWRSWCG